MRRVFPRILNALSFIFIILIMIPWANITAFMARANLQNIGFFNQVMWFMNNMEWLKLLFIPAILVLVAFLFYIWSSIDFAVHKNRTTRALVAMSLNPIAYLGLAMSALGLIVTFLQPYQQAMAIQNYNYMTLGQFIPTVIITFFSASKIFTGIFYGVLFLIQFVLVIFNNRLYKRGFLIRFLLLVLYFILAFLSYKGLEDYLHYAGGLYDIDLLGFGTNGFNPAAFSTIKSSNLNGVSLIHFIILYSIIAFMLVMYIILGIVRTIKNNKREKKESYEGQEAKKEEAQQPKGVEEFAPSVEDIDSDSESLFVVPKPEEEIVTEVEEKTVIRQVIYEKSDLNNVFETDFGFKNTSMVKRDGYNDYFVNKQKFLTLSNSNKTVSFRLELDKAIRLIIQYPLVGTDKYENHKIWFRIEDHTILNKDTVISIIKDAYNTVLNNE